MALVNQYSESRRSSLQASAASSCEDLGLVLIVVSSLNSSHSSLVRTPVTCILLTLHRYCVALTDIMRFLVCLGQYV